MYGMVHTNLSRLGSTSREEPSCNQTEEQKTTTTTTPW